MEKNIVSPLDMSVWMADELTKHIDKNKCPFARAIILTAITKLETKDHLRLYNELLDNTFWENYKNEK